MSDVMSVFSALNDGLRPDRYLTIDEWADAYRMLPKGASAEAGPYQTDRMPYLRDIMRDLSPQSPVQQVKVIKGTQIGASEVANNVVMYYMDIVPSSQLMILPTETLAKDHSNRKLTPSLRAMPYLSERITGGKSKDDIGGIFEKSYPGGMLKIAWAGSPANFRSLSCRVVVMDDVDGFPLDADGEGDPIDLGKKRTDSFGIQRKIYINSTPTVSGESQIEAEFEASDQRHYYMPCPHCSSMITFEFDGFVFDYDSTTYELTSDVKFACRSCGGLIGEHNKTKMMELGEWVPHNPGHRHRGYRIPAYLSPIGFLSWNEIFMEFLEAKKMMNSGDTRKMRTWKNTREALPWEDEMDTVDVADLPQRVEKYAAEVPEGVLVLTAGVDTQDDRFEIEVVGYGRDGETWSIDYHVIHGDPNDPETRRLLDAYLNSKTFEASDGAKMRIFAKAVDTGGHRTKAVYKFCKPRYAKRVYAIKGSSTPTAPFVNRNASRNNQANVPVFMIGVNAGKDEIYANLEITKPGPNYMHFPDKPQYNEEYFRQLTAEKRDKRKGIWVKFRHRNEAVDCRNYANAALLIAGVDDNILNRGKRIGVVSSSASSQTGTRRGRKILSRGKRR